MADKATRKQIRPPEAAADRLQNQVDFNLLLGVSFQSSTLLAARRIVKKKGYLYRNFNR